jgi:hypothetical protein
MAIEDSPGGWVPAACTLPTAQQPIRVAEFDEFFRTAVQRWTRPRATVLDLVISPQREASARDLAERETGCCSFLTFDFDPIADGLRMRIGVPEQHADVLDALQARVPTDAGATGVNEHG